MIGVFTTSGMGTSAGTAFATGIADSGLLIIGAGIGAGAIDGSTIDLIGLTGSGIGVEIGSTIGVGIGLTIGLGVIGVGIGAGVGMMTGIGAGLMAT